MITKQDGVKLFTTSQFIPDSEDTFEEALTLQIHAYGDDVEVYFEERMCELPRFVQNDLTLQQKIKSAIIEATDGM